MKPSHSFLYISSKVWLNALLVFHKIELKSLKTTALCFASDDPRTSCLFTNTAHVLTCRHTLLYKDLFSLITHLKPVRGGGGGIPGNLWWGCAARWQILILFQTKKSHFPHPSSDLPEAEIMLSLLRLERQQKDFFGIRILLFLAYLSGIEMTNTFIHSRIAPKTIPDSRPKQAISKLPQNSENKCRGLYFSKAYFEGLIFGGAYLGRKICVSKSTWLALWLEENLLFFPCFTLYLRAISKYKTPGGLIFGGAYFRNFTVYP